MKTVHKHIVPFDQQGLSLSLPTGYRLLKTQYMPFHKQVCCWVEVPTAPHLPTNEVQLRLFRSGDGIPQDYTYVDSAIDDTAPEAWHLFMQPRHAASAAA